MGWDYGNRGSIYGGVNEMIKLLIKYIKVVFVASLQLLDNGDIFTQYQGTGVRLTPLAYRPRESRYICRPKKVRHGHA